MARGKPSLEMLNRFLPEVPENMTAFAEAATDTIVPVVPVIQPALPLAPERVDVGVEVPVTPTLSPGTAVSDSEKSPITEEQFSVNAEHKNERRMQISLKLDESFYWKIRAASLARTQKTGKRVTVQDILEQLIVDNFR